MTTDLEQKEKNSNDAEPDEIDLNPFFEYLRSERGHEIASRIVTVIEDVKKASLDRNFAYAKVGTAASFIIVFAVIVASSTLAYLDKFDSTVALLFGTVVGYFFGKK